MSKYTYANPDFIADLGYQSEELADLYTAKAEANGNRDEYFRIADQLHELAEKLDDLSTEAAQITEE